MKLRNKKTGEILELCCHRSGEYREKYDSLAELNEEWEDYEEPKEYWYIDSAIDGDIDRNEIFDCEHCKRIDKFNKSIGNYFDTREEAEKAVEKLKAWKRLKDNGFRFTDYDVAGPVCDGEFCGQAFFRGGNYSRAEISAELDLLFGGEE